jgi:hypothetical protein
MNAHEKNWFPLSSPIGDYHISFCADGYPYNLGTHRHFFEPKYGEAHWVLTLRALGGYHALYCRNLWWVVVLRYSIVRKLLRA